MNDDIATLIRISIDAQTAVVLGIKADVDGLTEAINELSQHVAELRHDMRTVAERLARGDAKFASIQERIGQ